MSEDKNPKMNITVHVEITKVTNPLRMEVLLKDTFSIRTIYILE